MGFWVYESFSQWGFGPSGGFSMAFGPQRLRLAAAPSTTRAAARLSRPEGRPAAPVRFCPAERFGPPGPAAVRRRAVCLPVARSRDRPQRSAPLRFPVPRKRLFWDLSFCRFSFPVVIGEIPTSARADAELTAALRIGKGGVGGKRGAAPRRERQRHRVATGSRAAAAAGSAAPGGTAGV